MTYTRMHAQVFIATRFNVVYSEPHLAKDKSGNPTRTESWLARRFELFERICLPSMMAQTDSDFTWLVFFSDGTPRAYKERVAGINARFPAFVPIYLYDGEFMVGRFKKEVAARRAHAASHLITLRLDNDDALRRTMVQSVRGEFRGQDDEFINFTRGLQCEIDNGVIALAHEKSNPFIARIESFPAAEPRTVLEVMHYQAAETGMLRDISTVPMWLQVIHGGNVINRLDSGQFLYKADLLEDFAVTYPFRIRPWRTFRLSLTSIMVDRPLAFLRRLARRVLRPQRVKQHR